MLRDSSSLPGRSVELGPRARYRSRSESDKDLRTRLPGLMLASDWFAIAFVGFLVDTPFAWHDTRPLTHSLGIVLGATATVNCLHVARAYSVQSATRLAVQLAKVSGAWAASFVSLVTISYAMDRSQEFLSTWAGLWFGAAWLFLVAARCTVRLQIWRWQRDGGSSETSPSLEPGRRLSFWPSD